MGQGSERVKEQVIPLTKVHWHVTGAVECDGCTEVWSVQCSLIFVVECDAKVQWSVMDAVSYGRSSVALYLQWNVIGAVWNVVGTW